VAVPVQDLHRLLVALREQVKASTTENSTTFVHVQHIQQYNVLAAAVSDAQGLQIPELQQSGMLRVATFLDSVAFALNVLEVLDPTLGAQSAHPTDPHFNETKRPANDSTSKNTHEAPTAPKPTVFIGCSVEGLQFASLLQMNLEHSAHTIIWHQGVFGLSKGTLETLVAHKDRYDYAILVLTPDDVVLKREHRGQTARDNVIFELGLFMGALGRDRVFVVAQRGVALPTDLAGITAATFDTDGINAVAALGPVATRLQIEMGLIG
jgi:predicted nucleotide-binding protein